MQRDLLKSATTSLALWCVWCALGTPAAFAQAWPSKTITWIIPYAPGGFSDTRARRIGEHLGRALGQTVVIDNKAGAGGVVGTQLLAKAAPDGYTIAMGNLAPLAVNVSLMKKLPYDPKTDVLPVILIERAPLIFMVNPSVQAKNVAELVADAKKNPGKYQFGSSGVGGAHHLSGEMFKFQAGIDITHVPYKGGSAAATDLLAGHILMMFELGYAALPSIKAGKLRALAVTGRARLDALPDVPTMAESGFTNFESYNWQGVIVPAGTPRDIVMRLNRELNAILQRPDVREMIIGTAGEIAGGTPEAFGDFIRAETGRWAEVVQKANIQAE
jgi:tripartite-type tricarboxylate transporter receptor subunit TctC